MGLSFMLQRKLATRGFAVFLDAADYMPGDRDGGKKYVSDA